MCALISAGWWRSSAITATPSSSSGAASSKTFSVSSPSAPGWSFDHIDAVAELGAASGERSGDLGVEPRGDSKASAHFSSTATLSMCGVCGNMSTGFTRRSV